MFNNSISLSVIFMLVAYLFLSAIAYTFKPVRLVVWPIKLMIMSMLTSGCPFQFIEI